MRRTAGGRGGEIVDSLGSILEDNFVDAHETQDLQHILTEKDRKKQHKMLTRDVNRRESRRKKRGKTKTVGEEESLTCSFGSTSLGAFGSENGGFGGDSAFGSDGAFGCYVSSTSFGSEGIFFGS